MFTKCPNPVMQINYISCWILSSLERKFQYNNNIPGVDFSGGLFFKSASAVTTVPLTQYYSNIVFPCPTRHCKPPFISITSFTKCCNEIPCFLFCEICILKHEWPFEVALCSLIFGHNYVIFIDCFSLLNVLVEHFYTWLHTVLLINDLHIIWI